MVRRMWYRINWILGPVLLYVSLVFCVSITNTAPGYMLRGEAFNLAGNLKILLQGDEEYMVNQSQLEEFYAEGGTVIYEDVDKIRQDLNGKGVGYYSSWNMEIHLRNGANVGEFEHEFAHYLDFKYDISDREQFIQLVERNKNRLHWLQIILINMDYAAKSMAEDGSAREYFAEIYKCYNVKPKLLKSLVPEAYSFMCKLEEEMV